MHMAQQEKETYVVVVYVGLGVEGRETMEEYEMVV